MSTPEQPYGSREATFAAFSAHVNRGKVKAYDALGFDVVMGERDGARFRDAFSGRWLWNCHCNGGLFNLGHRNPRVLDAARRALDSLDVGNHHLVSGHRARLAEQLADTTDGLLPGVVLSVSGSEANEVALKLARSREGRRTVVSVHGSYHGHTGLAVAAGDAEYSDPFRAGLPEFVHVPFDDLDAMAAAVDETTACVLLEPIPATLGMPIPSPGYLAGVERICREHGALLVLDEVQTGLGRTGSFWHYEQEDVRPDMVTSGKGLGGGLYPMGATLIDAELYSFFDEHPLAHFSTAGGSELGCAVAGEVVDMVREPGFLERVRELSDRFAGELSGLPCELRRRGLFMALKFRDPGDGIDACIRLIRAGVFVVFAGTDTSAVQFLPPLVLTDAEVTEICGLVREALG